MAVISNPTPTKTKERPYWNESTFIVANLIMLVIGAHAAAGIDWRANIPLGVEAIVLLIISFVNSD